MSYSDLNLVKAVTEMRAAIKQMLGRDESIITYQPDAKPPTVIFDIPWDAFPMINVVEFVQAFQNIAFDLGVKYFNNQEWIILVGDKLPVTETPVTYNKIEPKVHELNLTPQEHRTLVIPISCGENHCLCCHYKNFDDVFGSWECKIFDDVLQESEIQIAGDNIPNVLVLRSPDCLIAEKVKPEPAPKKDYSLTYTRSLTELQIQLMKIAEKNESIGKKDLNQCWEDLALLALEDFIEIAEESGAYKLSIPKKGGKNA